MTSLLEGLKVIDMGHLAAIPAAAVTLADWGADVIKVEPLSGEMARGTTRTVGVAGVDWGVQLMNRNKKSLALDLKKEVARNILYRLVERSDIFMSNYESSALRKLKVDYATLSKFNPRLIYASVTAYGTEGPDRDERGLDYSAAWARGGMQYIIGELGLPPRPQRPAMMDRVTAAHVVSGILAALIHRDKTGQGQELEVSLFHTGVWTLSSDIQAALVGSPLPQHQHANASNPLANFYRTKDDRWFMMVMIQSDLFWPDFCRVIERHDLEHDPRFNTLNARALNCEELIRIIDEIFATKTMAEWDKRLREHHCMYSRVQTPLEVTTDPQALANGFFAEIDNPNGGKMTLVTTPVRFFQDPASVRTPAPEVGQHTEEILLDMGYTWDDIARFKEQKSIP
jgi:crotonobetainyl-CoA:carnitine CoA-transferase CaiB-like acyl-CoA transferase